MASKIALASMASKMAASKLAFVMASQLSFVMASKLAFVIASKLSFVMASKLASVSYGLLPRCFSLLSSCHSVPISEKLPGPRLLCFA